jgi:hypothetical protein
VSAPNSSLLKQSHNAEKVCAASPPPKPLSVHQPGEQAGERDVAAADVSMKAVVDNVEQGDTLSSAMVEPSNAVDCGVEVEQEVEREEASLHGKLVLKDEAESSSSRSNSADNVSYEEQSLHPTEVAVRAALPVHYLRRHLMMMHQMAHLHQAMQ